MDNERVINLVKELRAFNIVKKFARLNAADDVEAATTEKYCDFAIESTIDQLNADD